MKYTILGLMSGSSLDGLDCAIVSFEFRDKTLFDWEVLFTQTIPFDQKLVTILPDLSLERPESVRKAHAYLGQWIGQQCHALIREAGIRPDYIASHGHTIVHKPADRLTLQIGDPQQIAQLSNCPVIYNLRSADVAAGGQGAPLAPVVERYCFPGHTFYLNLGGIANLSRHADQYIQAWDLCPCNQLLNFLARRLGLTFDAGGKIAASGRVLPSLLQELHTQVALPLQQPFTLDNTWIQHSYFPILDEAHVNEDLLRTSVEYISEAIGRQVASLPASFNTRLLATGGGAHNHFLVERIRANLPDAIELTIPDTMIIDFKEAILIALCGALRVQNLPNSFASVTGATHDTVNGVILDINTSE